MDIKEQIHALSDEMIANLGKLVAIDLPTWHTDRGQTIW